MKYTDEELREMMLKASHEYYCLTDNLVDMKAPAAFIHNILGTNLINDAEEDVVNRLDRYRRARSALNCLKANDVELPYNKTVYFFNKDEGVSWGTLEELLSDDSIYDGEEFVLTVEEIVPTLLRPLLDMYIDDKDTEGIYQVGESISYVFNHMLEEDEDAQVEFVEGL